ncbi:MAG: hypothetical protein JW729_06925 [Bacteroidales bacterium]|nr:hypothetical protein [Bacteroidales bacterium]
MELTDKNSTRNFTSIAFEKGENSISLTPPNVASFSSTTINWTPNVSTGLEEIASSKSHLYPNPSNGNYTILCPDFKSYEIRSLNGEFIHHSTLTKQSI